MEIQEFFLEQYNTVRWIISDLFLKDLTDDQLRHQPKEGLNSIAWYMWHTARWQDFSNTLISPGRKQVLNKDWLVRLNLSRLDVGTGMTREECTEFNKAVNIEALKAYWDAVGDAVRDVARSVVPQDLGKPVDSAQIQAMLVDGTIANERANWVPGLLEGKPRSWFLSMAVWHTAEHLLGGVVCVRRVSGIPVGL
jgi:DinB superfamily